MSDNYSTVNPCVMCMPMGSVLAFKGIENTMPFFHGSQGCSTYIRLYLAHHFREPVDIASSALSEKGAVYGGGANLKQGLKNVIKAYNPKVIGVATTCLAETIGDNLPLLIKEFMQENESDVMIVSVSTPSYRQSHEHGYNETLKAIVENFAEKTYPNQRINLIIGAIVSPADIRYLKELLENCNLDYILLPDISETFDAPIVKTPPKIPSGGTFIKDIRDMANSIKTITLGTYTKTKNAGTYLDSKFCVPNTTLPLPIGLEFTDMFIERITDKLPRKYELERGRLIDAMIDIHKYVANVKTAVFGDTDIVIGITKLITEIGMNPLVIATGEEDIKFVNIIKKIAPNSKVLCGANFVEIHDEIKNNGIELMVGPFTGRQISKKENIPLVRVGFPNHDRVGASRQLILGYDGAMRLIDEITNTIIEKV